MPPVSGSEEREELLSAIRRLPHAVLTCDGQLNLRPINHAALKLMQREKIAPELPSAEPEHPLSRVIAMALRGGGAAMHVLQLPSGSRFEVDVSIRSQRGQGSWLLLICRDLSLRSDEELDLRFHQWNLTPRESEIARQICQGFSTDQICERLGIAPNTVKTHVSNILAKSGSTSRSAFLAKVHGLLPSGSAEKPQES